MPHTVTLIPGDGIGPEITEAVVRVIEATGADIQWDRRDAGVSAIERHNTPIPPETLESIRATRVALKGPLTTPVGVGFRSINVALRKEFDLYANVRPAKTLVPGGRYQDVDIVLIRENTEGLYSGVEHYVGIGGDPRAAAESVMLVTRFGVDRILRYAFEYAVQHGRKKVTLAHKANILKYTQGLFLDVGREMAKEYAGRVEFEDRIIDAAAMMLVMDPAKFDVIVCENMFGDILSDLIAGLVGGLGLAPGANIGKDASIFEAVHGSAPDIAGKGVANPLALLTAGVMMLEHLGMRDEGARIRKAFTATVLEKDSLTPDLGGTGTTSSIADAVIRRL
ncbi:isocitrate/isopropylmalate dehydrogenase family protein [Longimicrobium terrae]|uniref:Isocitrate dehydrogenase (NAD+) n=1 Tax=Longimicrobium terrae TaxID=1639882 RepID=A0A841GR70_9BACT|nr:isocitrate/isopropylmalate family dehydrogenase [Longimicrobium terrae]MBB4634381.1 isocitrate dehydrogenase (NAD+) [Longimicrobium terrae]MBB6068729.1 isocitrate dehydrogenase (NAD+) [Longimicrobium terrae]NNC27915.1 NAD-dependent isocitrate dehydrogenase [Longimicrobium terrae]